VRVRVGWPGPTLAYPIGPTCTNHPWHPTTPGPLYRPNACQLPWPTLLGERVPTTLACPIRRPHGGHPSLPYRPNAYHMGLHRSSCPPPPAVIKRAVLEHTNVSLIFTALSAARRGLSGLQEHACMRSRYIQVN